MSETQDYIVFSLQTCATCGSWQRVGKGRCDCLGAGRNKSIPVGMSAGFWASARVVTQLHSSLHEGIQPNREVLVG